MDRLSLSDGPVAVRLLRVRDAAAWTEVRRRNEQWLSPWEGRVPAGPDLPWADRHTPGVFVAMARQQRREARTGRSLPFAITYNGDFVGQVTVGSIVRGAFDCGYLGYWVDRRVAGRGVAPTAVALVVDHCFRTVGLHRIDVNVRPENAASRRVVDKLGFREEGLHRRYLFIDGAWRDHVAYALTVEDVPDGLLARWHATRGT